MSGYARSRAGLGLLFDAKRCIGCMACSIACKAENRFPSGVAATRIEKRWAGSFPDVKVHFAKMACMHCGEPACVKVCPTGSLFRTDVGLVSQDPERCIGCGYCEGSCPLEVPRRSGGRAHKCGMCAHRVERGEEPACAATCPTSALTFGERANLRRRAEARVAQLSRHHPGACVYEPASLGGTSVAYVLYDEPSVFGLRQNPRVPMAVEIWQDAVKPYGIWLIPLALIASAVSFVSTRVRKVREEEGEDGEGEGE